MTLYRAPFLRTILLVSSRFGEALRIVQDYLADQKKYSFPKELTNCGDK